MNTDADDSTPEEEFVNGFLTRERVLALRATLENTFLKVHDGVSRAKLRGVVIRWMQAEVMDMATGRKRAPVLDPIPLPELVEKRLRVILPDLFFEE